MRNGADCYECKYAFITDKPTVITTKTGTTLMQVNGGATCTLSLMPGGLKANIMITNEELKCSAFEPKETIKEAKHGFIEGQ